MRKLTNLKPSSVFYYFEDICEIPHGSGNIEKISDYLVKFAKDHSLKYIQDHVKNVIIFKEASSGYEDQETIILQSHMDMVTVQKSSSNIDLEQVGINICLDGDRIYAKDTSLGGDNGIGMSYALGILSSDDLEHPRLECIFTVDEEVGMDGAAAIDLSMLQGRKLINIDSEEEGVLLSSCAGGSKLSGSLVLEAKEMSGMKVTLTLSGCKGGHSGVEIHTGRANAIYVLMRCLLQLDQEFNYGIVSVEGGQKDNAIPREARAIIVMKEDDFPRLEEVVKVITNTLAREYVLKEDGISLVAMKEGNSSGASDGQNINNACFDSVRDNELRRMFSFILNQPDGVISMSSSMEGVVETSLNLGILKLDKGILTTCYAVRSNIDSAREALVARMNLLIEQLGGSCTIGGEYPAWEYLEESKLRERMKYVYNKLYGRKIRVEGVHAGLECGILSKKIKGLDCVSIGPNMEGIHTTEECFSIASVDRVWNYLLAVLQEKNETSHR